MRDVKDRVLTNVYQQYSGKVYLYLYSLCHSSALAQDLMQETFYRAMLSLSGGRDVFAWLMRVARNLYFDECRKRRRLVIADVGEVPDGSDMLQTVITSEKNRKLYGEIQKLSLREREAVTLYYFGGLDQRQAAWQMGISYANVRTLLHRARKRLYESMKEEQDGI